MTLGIVVISHSASIAQGIVALLNEVAKDVPITFAGGTEDGGIGTSAAKVMSAVEENTADKLLTFFDLGSARMNLEIAQEMTEKDMEIFNVPVVEGAYVAAAMLQVNTDYETVKEELNKMIIEK